MGVHKIVGWESSSITLSVSPPVLCFCSLLSALCSCRAVTFCDEKHVASPTSRNHCIASIEDVVVCINKSPRDMTLPPPPPRAPLQWWTPGTNPRHGSHRW